VIPKESGVAEVVRHAFRVDFWDVEEIATKVVGLLTYPALWEELSEAGLAEVRSPRLGLDQAAGRTAAAYARALLPDTGSP
jgi:glycosyltransferase involved in cell wall biosynthesis